MTKRKVEVKQREEVVVPVLNSEMLDDDRRKLLFDLLTEHGEVMVAFKMERDDDESMWDFVSRYHSLRQELQAYGFDIPEKPDGVE